MWDNESDLGKKNVGDLVFEPEDNNETSSTIERSPFHEELAAEQGMPEPPKADDQNGAGLEKNDVKPAEQAQPEQARPERQRPEQPAVRDVKEVPWVELEKEGNDTSNLEGFKAARTEMIRRLDEAMSPEQYKQSIESIPILLKALKEGKALATGRDGQKILLDKDLTPAERLRFHDAIEHDLSIIAQQAVIRMEFSQLLYRSKQYADAEQVAKDAIEKADVLPLEMIEQTGKQLLEDLKHISDPVTRDAMRKRAISYSRSTGEPSLYRMPLMTRKGLAAMYLGAEVELLPNGKTASIAMGRNVLFKPDKAYELAKETRAKTKELLGFDPMDEKAAMQDPSVATIYGSIMEVLDNPKKYNLFKLVDENKLENLYRELKQSSGFENMLVDVGVVTLVAGALCLSRSPKTHAAIERLLGRSANAEAIAPTLSKSLGFGTALVGAPLLRHYGFEALSGVKESWSDTGIHVIGSLAAAELGGRLLGKGSMITGSSGRGLRALEGFDAIASSEWLGLHGYETTGKVADLLIANGHTKEAAILLKLPRGTALASEAGLKALEVAELTQSRMSSVGKAVSIDQKAASGIDHSKLAKSLESKGTKPITDVNGLVKQLQEDAQLLREVDGKGLRRGTSISEALGNKAITSEGGRIEERLTELGVENVGQARDLLKSLDKGLESQFPKLHELQKANAIGGTTSLAEVARMTSHAFDGPGMTRLIKLLPEAERPAILSDRTLYALSRGEKPQSKISQMVAEQYNPHGLAPGPEFYNVPTGNALKNTAWGTSLRGAAGTVLTYNTIVKAWDQMEYVNPNTGTNYTFAEALQEAHLPGLSDQNTPEVLRLINAVGAGSPGQIFLASLMIRPGAIAKPVWSDASLSTTSKLWRSSPFSPSAWNNWNAGIFSKPGMGSAGALSGALYEPAKNALAEGSEHKSRMKSMLENVQRPIENQAAPAK